MNLLDIYDLGKDYYTESSRTMERKKIEVIKNVSLQIREKESVAIMGKSGCGKTTLLKMIGSLLVPTTGSIYYKGKNLLDLQKEHLERYRRTEIGFVFQDYKLLESMTVKENMILPCVLDHQDIETSLCKIAKMAERLKISDRLDHYPSELSGGEKQRVAIGRALINSPSLILADEPTGNLDFASSKIVMELLVKLQQELNITMILVTHDKEVANYCDRVVQIQEGQR